MTNSNVEFIQKVICMLPTSMFFIEVKTWIACQFALESNYGRSALTSEYFNATGMKMPKVRCTTAVCKNTYGFASFVTLSECVTDYLLWLAWNRFSQNDCHSLATFKSRLKLKGYCPEHDYFDRVDSIYKEFCIITSN